VLVLFTNKNGAFIKQENQGMGNGNWTPDGSKWQICISFRWSSGDHDHGVLGGLAIMISIYISDSGQMYVNLSNLKSFIAITTKGLFQSMIHPAEMGDV
jgi:hypothetical protein